MNTEVSAGSGAIEQSIGWPPKLIPLLLGGAVAGVLYLIVLSTLYPIFSVPEEIATLPDPPPVAAIERLEAAIYARDVKNLGIAFTVGGILCGAALTLASAGLRKPKGLILASVCGGISGGLGAFLANLLVTKTRSIGGGDLILVGITLDHMMQTMLTQFALWGVLGLGLGAGFALGLRGPSQAIKGAIGGMLGGGLFGLLYTPIHATLSIKNSSELLPDTTGERLVWFVLACLCIAVGIALGLGERKPKTSQASAAA